MASLSRDPRFPKGPFRCHFVQFDGTRTCRSTGKYNRKEAQIVCQTWQQAEHEAMRGDLTRDRVTRVINETLVRMGQDPVGRTTVEAWLSDFLEAKTRLVPSVAKKYQRIFDQFLDSLGTKKSNRWLDSINEKDIRRFLTELHARKLNPSTINNYLFTLGAAFLKAQNRGLIQVNPTEDIEAEDVESVGHTPFPPEQVAQLVATAKGTDWEGACLYAWGHGTRLGDTCNVRHANLDLEYLVTTFQPQKTKKEITIGIHPGFVEWLLSSPPPSNSEPFVFPSLAGRETKGRKGLSNEFIDLMGKAGIKRRLLRESNGGESHNFYDLSFHSFRHDAVSSVWNAATAKEIARRVSGHSSSAIDRYIHVNLDNIRAATALIPRIPKGGISG